MRAAAILLSCAGLAILTAGCGPLDRAYIREGIGTELGSAELPEVTRLQDVYVGEICRQAGLRVSRQGELLLCDEASIRPSEWATVVQAGMNDIDRRCDAYLGWLDNQRRWREPVLKQINITAATTAAILGLTGVGPTPIAIVGAAFGFAQDTFTNYNTRLITEVNHAVVQSVVLGNQNEFRVKLAPVPVNNRPAAIYLLRNYLRICTPFSIEMSITDTITTLHRAGPDALRTEPVLTRAPTIARVEALGPRERFRRPDRRSDLPTLPDYALIIANYDGKVHTISKVEPALIKLCVPGGELRAIGERAKLLIRIYQMSAGLNVTGQLRTRDIASLNNLADCPIDRLNYYEAHRLTGPLNSPERIALFNAALAEGRKLRENATELEIRSRISEIRSAFSSKLKLQSPFLANQLTPDLVAELTRLQLR
jgi:hypothetical protein